MTNTMAPCNRLYAAAAVLLGALVVLQCLTRGSEVSVWLTMIVSFALGCVLIAAGAALLQAPVRRRAACLRCGYSEHGRPCGSICPECGAAPDFSQLMAPGWARILGSCVTMLIAVLFLIVGAVAFSVTVAHGA